MKRISSVLIALTISLVLMGFSCDQKAAKVGLGVAASAQAFQQAELAMHKQGKIADDEHIAIQQALLDLGISGQALNKCIGAGGGAPCVDSTLVVVERLAGSPINGVKNPDSKKQLQALLAALQLAFTNLKAAL